MLLHALLLAVGVCSDKSKDCYTWFVDGQCESNPTYMKRNCPLSCNVCNHANCTDQHQSCSYWARKGECENNTDFMLHNCPTACGVCTPRCEDTHGGFKAGPSANETMCELWARQGDCVSNPDFVLKHCPVACGVCRPKCKDMHKDCSQWANAGECASNAAFMLTHCGSACAVCVNETSHTKAVAAELHLASGGEKEQAQARLSAAERLSSPGGCHDVHDECSKWVASGECSTNPQFMLRECAASCGLCTTVCADHDERCVSWATLKDGHECDENKSFMQKQCPASCGVCSAMQQHLAETKAKEEL